MSDRFVEIYQNPCVWYDSVHVVLKQCLHSKSTFSGKVTLLSRVHDFVKFDGQGGIPAEGYIVGWEVYNGSWFCNKYSTTVNCAIPYEPGKNMTRLANVGTTKTSNN